MTSNIAYKVGSKAVKRGKRLKEGTKEADWSAIESKSILL
jgi:hypothetical protein